MDKVTKRPSKNSFSEQPQRCIDRLQHSCSGMEVGRGVWRCCSSWVAGEEEKGGIAIWSRPRPSGVQVRVVVKLSAGWEVEVEGLHTRSHSVHLLGDKDKQSHGIFWQLVSV